MNNGSGDAKEQNIVGARELSGVTLTPTTTGSASVHQAVERVRVLPLPFRLSLPSPFSPEVINVANSRQLLSSSSAVSDRNRAVTFSCYTCTIIIVSRNHACRIVYGYISRGYINVHVDRAVLRLAV